MRKSLFCLLFILHSYFVIAQWQYVGGVPCVNINTAYNFNDTLLLGTSAGLIYNDKSTGSWKEIKNNSILRDISFISSSGSKLYVISNFTTILATSDFGMRWDTIWNGDLIRSFIVHKDSLLITKYSGPMAFTPDSGRTWVNRNAPQIGSLQYTNQGIFGFTNPGGLLWKTTNWGLTWNQEQLPGMSLGYIRFPHKNTILIKQFDEFYILRDSMMWEKLIIPTSSFFNILYADNNRLLGYASDSLYYSLNGGSSWDAINQTLRFSFYEYIKDTLFTATSRRTFKSINEGQTFEPLFDGLDLVSQVESITSGASTFLLSNNCGTYISKNKGQSWEQIDAFGQSILFTGVDNRFYALNNSPWFSHDEGNSWNIVMASNRSHRAMSVNGNTLFSAIETNIYRHRFLNDRYSEEFMQTGIQLNTIAEMAGIDSIVVVVDALGTIIFSDNLGDTWQNIIYNLHRFNNTGFFDLDIRVIKDAICVVDKISRRIFKLDKINNQWLEVLPEFRFDRINFIKRVDNFILMGVQGKGMFISSDAINWKNINDNITKFNPTSVTNDDLFVYIGINGGGVWKRAIADLKIITKNREILQPNTLVSVSPNPTSGILNIHFLDKKLFNKAGMLTLYNTAGKEVVNARIQNLQDIYQINLGHLPKGIYFLTIKNDHSTVTEKVVVQ